MKKTVSLTKNYEFMRLYKRGMNQFDYFLATYVTKTKRPGNRLGITVSSKIGNAVVRNRVRRRIKESYLLLENDLKSGYDIVIVARRSAATADFRRILKSLTILLKKAGLYETTV